MEKNVLSKIAIDKYLKNDRWSILCFDKIDSTNTRLKNMAKSGAKEFLVLATDMQSEGRGRLGKTFFSPKGCGVYFSLLLKPSIKLSDSVFITVAAAVSVRRAIKKLLNIETEIKWVNDIYYNGKKLCGILTEAISIGNSLSSAVLGIGINIKTPKEGYPEEFAYKTTSISEIIPSLPDDFNNMLIAEVLNQFDILYDNLEKKEYIKEYKLSSCILGKKIDVLSGEFKGETFLACDIDENACLVVCAQDGSYITLSSGDVSIRI